MAVGEDRRTAVVGYYRILGEPDPGPVRLRLRGLDPDATYVVTPWPSAGGANLVREPRGRQTGAELMAAGIALELGRHETMSRGDFWTRLFVLDADG